MLKSGCRVEAHQHRSARALARAIAIDAVVGWRIMLLTLLGRQMPQLPAQDRLQPMGVPVARRARRGPAIRTADPQKRGLCLGTAVMIIAKLGGALLRPCDPPPGAQSLWRGYSRFQDILLGYRIRDRGG